MHLCVVSETISVGELNMSFQHHGENEPVMSDQLRKLFEDSEAARKRLSEQLEGRAKRSWSDGRLGGEDDGDLAFAIGPHPEKELVVIDFGKQVEWIAMPPQQAVELAQALIKQARAVSKTPLKYSLH